jgi:hypothetical protein
VIGGALEAQERGMEMDRNLLGFTPAIDSGLRRMIEYLRSGKAEVRRYTKTFLHGKAYLFSTDEGVFIGSANLTPSGLLSNMELSTGQYQPTPVVMTQKWFEDMWAEAVPYDLAGLYEARFIPYDPYLIYLRILYELFGAEVEEEAKAESSPIRLTSFQNDGMNRALRILEENHGVIIADGVGLGKSYMAGEILRRVTERRQRSLLISPAALRDGAWARFFVRHQLYCENVSYEELTADVQLGGEQSNLKSPIDEYSLIVIDEAQAFRNPDTRRAGAIRRLLRGRVAKDLVLLSATPVNNSIYDLYYLLTLFIQNDAAFADRGIISLKGRFDQAAGIDPYDLTPDTLFSVIDATTVRRTRRFVKKYYPEDRVIGPSGEEIPVRFPNPHVRRVDYSLSEVLPGFFEDFARALMPEDGKPILTMARYIPSAYRRDGRVEGDEIQMVGLLRSGLLKRFESSSNAFARTAEKMAASCDMFLGYLSRGLLPESRKAYEVENTDTDEVIDFLLEEGLVKPIDTAAYDLDGLRRDVALDRDLLRGFANRASTVTQANDPKMKALVERLAAIADHAQRRGGNPEEQRDLRKVLLFTYFQDTLNWIEEGLKQALETDPRLAIYRGRMASTSSDSSRNGISRADAMFGFAPVSSEAPAGRNQDRFDILLTTDVLAEGANLQQCAHIINYDLPWNPMRLVQRDGRIDRIGSTHEDIYLLCFFPDRELDELLELEDRIRRKLAQAAATIGVETQVIPDGATGDQVFTETMEEIQAIRREDDSLLEGAGEDPCAHSGEEYRQELRRGLIERGTDVRRLPWAAGSGLRRGDRRGHLFCARVGEKVFLRFVPFAAGEPVRDVLGCLRFVTCSEDTQRLMPDDLKTGAYAAWQTARTDIFKEWMLATDPANLQPKVRLFFHRAAEHLRKNPPAGKTAREVDRLVESLEAPWGRKIEARLKETFENQKISRKPSWIWD